MESAELIVSVATLNLLFFLLSYLPVGLICYRQLFPLLSPTCRRISGLMLVAQVLVIFLSIQLQPSSAYAEWLWRLEGEWNIPSVPQSTQYALVGAISLLIAFLVREKPAWQRLYLLGMGLVFLYLGHVEYFAVKWCTLGWKNCSALLGASVVLSTLVVAVRSSWRARLWHICFLVGLSLIGTGGLVFDNLPKLCGKIGFFYIDGCLNPSKAPDEIMELLGGWLALIAMLGLLSNAMPTLQPRVRRVLYVFPLMWITLLIVASPVHSLSLHPSIQPTSVQFETGIHFHGFVKGSTGLPSVGFMFVPDHAMKLKLGYSIHLIDQVSGLSIASWNDRVDQEEVSNVRHDGYLHFYEHGMSIEFPPGAPVNRALWVVLTHWREHDGDFVRQQVLASDLQLLDERQVLLGELVLPELKHAPATDLLAEFDDGFILHTVDMPENARSGVTLPITFTWRATADGLEDHVQFLHFMHEEDGTWWVYDQQPLGARLPTRLWYKGLVDSETWQVPLPADLAPGRYRVFTGLYRTRDRERVPARDGDGDHFGDNRVPLRTLIIER